MDYETGSFNFPYLLKIQLVHFWKQKWHDTSQKSDNDYTARWDAMHLLNFSSFKR